MAGGDEECLRELSRLREGGSGTRKSGSKLPHCKTEEGTGIDWPWRVWYLTAPVALLRSMHLPPLREPQLSLPDERES